MTKTTISVENDNIPVVREVFTIEHEGLTSETCMTLVDMGIRSIGHPSGPEKYKATVIEFADSEHSLQFVLKDPTDQTISEEVRPTGSRYSFWGVGRQLELSTLDSMIRVTVKKI